MASAPKSKSRRVDRAEIEKAPPLSRVEKRKKHIVAVAMGLIRERGFDAVSVNKLAEIASISVGGLYRYIGTKTDLLAWICDEINRGVIAEMEVASAQQGSYADKLAAAVSVYWDRVWDYSSAISVAYREYKNFPEAAQKRHTKEQSDIAAFFAAITRQGIAAGEFQPVDDHMLSYQILLLSHIRVLKGWALTGRAKEELLDENMSLILARLIPAPQKRRPASAIHQRKNAS